MSRPMDGQAEIARFLQQLKWIVLGLVGLWVVWLLAPILTPFVFGALLGWMGDPLVDRLERAGRSRNVAVALVFGLMTLLLVLALLILVPMLERQVRTLVESLPAYRDWFVQTAVPWLEARTGLELMVWLDPERLVQWVREHWQQAGGFATAVFGYIEAGQVVLARRVHVRHLGGLAADQGAAGLLAAAGDAADHRDRGVHVELAGGEVVQEEQRLGALDQDVVDAHGDQVDADGVVAAQLLGQLELGADAVGAGDQHRLAVLAGQVEQGAEPAQAAHHLRAEAAPHQRLDPLHDLVAGVDVHARVAVGQGSGRRSLAHVRACGSCGEGPRF